MDFYDGYTHRGHLKPVDVICQHSSDGTIIPIKIRITEYEGSKQSYVIQGYRQLPINGGYTTSDGVYVTKSDIIFVCRIFMNDALKNIRLYYAPQTGVWQIAG